MCGVFAARAVAAFASDVPLRDSFGMNVVVSRVAAIARSACRTLHVVRWIVGSPPVCSSVWHVIGSPCFIAYVPLNRKRIVVVSHFGKVALLPLAAIDKCNLFLRKPYAGIG